MLKTKFVKRISILLLIFCLDHAISFSQESKNANEFVLDGKLNESLWQTAKKITGFKLIEPGLGGLPTDKVKAFISYNDKYLFVAVECFRKDISKVYASSLERDLPLVSDD